MAPPPIGLLNSISPDDWSHTPAAVQRLVERLVAAKPATAAEVQRQIQTLQAQIQREKALNRVVQTLRNSLDLDTIFATATAEVVQTLASPDCPLDCYVAQYMASEGLWRTVAEAHHDPSSPSTLGHEIPDGGNPFAAQLRALRRVCLSDTDRLQDANNWAVAQDVPGAWLLTPLVVEGELWGSFSLATPQRPFVWGVEQLDLAQAIAHQLEVAIQQASLYRRVQQELEERQRIETALHESQARWQAVADNVPGVIYGYRLRPDGREEFTYISSGFREIYGFEREAALADTGAVWRCIHPDDVAPMRQSIEVSGRTLETWQAEYRITTPAGEVRWLQGTARPTAQANGDVIWDGLIVDVSDRKRTEAALAASEQKLSTLISNLPGYIYRVQNDPDYTADFISQGVEAITGYRVEEYLVHRTTSCGQEIHPDDRDRVWQQVQTALAEGRPYECEYRLITKAGQEKWVWERGQGICSGEGALLYLEGFVTDISHQKQAEAALRESEARYRLLAENTNDLICLHDVAGHCLYVSPSCTPLLGYRYDEMRGRPLGQFVHPDDRDRVHAEMAHTLAGDKANPVTYRVRHRQGHYLWFETLTHAIVNQAGAVVQLQTTSRDVTERVQAQQQLRHEALHDPLTGLPNRHSLMLSLRQALDRTQQDVHYRFGVLFLDLDRFKVINDSLGHLVGDQLLIAIANRVQATLGDGDLVARLGGDEFVVVLHHLSRPDGATAQAQHILATLATPLVVAGREVYTTASIGIVIGHSGYSQADHLLRDADIAMYRAKAQGKACHALFDASMHTAVVDQLHLESDLRRAIARGDLDLHYQPIVALATGTVVGFEALTRWHHPSRGPIPPSEFIPLAEEIGLVSPIDYWAIATACRQIAQWQRQFPHLGPLHISVNLSAQDLRQPDLLTTLDRVLRDTGLPGACLVLEITESMLIEDIQGTIALFDQIHARQVRLSIDDFGTGYSSLNYLHRLPVHYLKVDQSFVAQAKAGEPNHPLMATIITLGTQLGLDTIAEGVETPYQRDQLCRLGYGLGQGYFFSPPLSAAAAAVLLAAAPPPPPSPLSGPA